MESRKEKRTRSKRTEGKVAKSSGIVAFDQWFYSEAKRNPNLRATQFSEIQVFMKKQGLSEREDREAYEKALEKY